MRQALDKWLKKFQTDFSIDTAHSLCNNLGLDGEKIDECLGLCYQLEKGDINEADFTGGLCVLTGKKAEEIAEVLRGMKAKTVPEEGQPFSADTMWDIDELTTKVEDGANIEEALEAWKTSEKWENLRKLVGFTKGSADYRSSLHRILRKQYGDKIIVWRGGEPGIGLTSVTPSRDAAVEFQEWRGGVLERFTIDTNKVLAAIPTVESELIVNVADLERRIDDPKKD